MHAKQLIAELESHHDPHRVPVLQRFFKTGKGEYAEGDIFWGLTIPQVRSIVRHYTAMPSDQLPLLLKHPVHEVRLCALAIMSEQAKHNPEEIFELYMSNTTSVNNWDLVDGSAGPIVGMYLYDKDRSILYKLARSKLLWERRIAIMSTFYFIRKGETTDTFAIATILLHDTHDLIHKAVGWMLREVGKRVDEQQLLAYLDENASKMPRTMLRYAIERLPASTRARYLAMGKKKS